MESEKIHYADDDTMSVRGLLKMRIPSLIVGLLLGIVLSFVTSRFEKVLSFDVKVAFFIPLIVYIAAAVGAQTQSIYIRDLKTGKASFKKYLIKETFLGVLLGAASSAIVAAITIVWFGSLPLTLAVSLAIFVAVSVAPLVALLVTQLLQLEHTDPAVGSGPISTVIQDSLTILIYGIIASFIIL